MNFAIHSVAEREDENEKGIRAHLEDKVSFHGNEFTRLYLTNEKNVWMNG